APTFWTSAGERARSMQVERRVPSDSPTRAGARSSAVTMAWALEMQAVGSGRLSWPQPAAMSAATAAAVIDADATRRAMARIVVRFGGQPAGARLGRKACAKPPHTWL